MATAPNVQKGQRDDQAKVPVPTPDFSTVTEQEIDEALSGVGSEEEEVTQPRFRLPEGIKQTRSDIRSLLKPRPAEEELEELEVAEYLVDEPTVNDGGKSETLSESLHTFEFPDGIQGAAATSLAGYKFEKEKNSDRPKNRNEDRWVVNPQTGFVALVDGMGGGNMGEEAAEIVASQIASHEDRLNTAKDMAAMALLDKKGGSNDGACFLTAKIQTGKPIDINQCGDLELHQYGSDGKVKYRAGDYMKMGKDPQSAFDYLESLANRNVMGAVLEGQVQFLAKSAMKDMSDSDQVWVKRIVDRVVTQDRPFVEKTNPLFGPLRSMVVNALNSKQTSSINYQTPQPVEADDWILLMSDGVSDNFTQEELDNFVRYAIRFNWSPAELVRKISEELDTRIKLRAKEDPKAMQNHYKLDNATIVVLRAPAKAARAA